MRPAPRSTPTRRNISSGSRDWNAPGNISELVCARQRDPPRSIRALQFDRTLRVSRHRQPGDHRLQQDARPTAQMRLLVDRQPRSASHAARASCDVAAMLSTPTTAYVVRDLLDDAAYTWRGGWNYVRLDPDVRQGHILQLDARRSVASTDDPGLIAYRSTQCRPARIRRRRRRSALVQGRDHLSGARQVVLRQQQRRHRRLPGPDAEARLPAGARHHLPLAAAVLPVAAARTTATTSPTTGTSTRATARSTTSRRSSTPRTSGTSRC